MNTPNRLLSLAVSTIGCAFAACAIVTGVFASSPPKSAGLAALPSDFGREPTVMSLPSNPAHHWVWINDLVFAHMSDGTAHLVDGDTGTYLGSLSTGFGFERLVLPHSGKVIYSPETYFSRGTRGTRTDVVTLYDAVTLKDQGEIQIPAKRSANLPKLGNAALTDDDRFLLVFNFTPAQSVSVVDTVNKTFVGEVETAGCTFVYPTSGRSFFSVCADGSLLSVSLDESGHAANQTRTEPLLDLTRDPVGDNPVRVGDTWYFVSYDGELSSVVHSERGLTAGPRWWLTTAQDRHQGWRPGGLQLIAAHATSGALYVIMHQGGRETHKDPGRTVWVYDASAHKRTATIAMRELSSSIQVTPDEHPLLFSSSLDSDALDVYNASTGEHLRAVKAVATTPTVLLTP